MHVLLKIPVIGFLLFFQPVFSQKSEFSFRVYDKVSNQPIQFCYVVVQGKQVSSLSDEKGVVTLTFEPHDTIVVFQSGYHLHKGKAGLISDTVFLYPKNVQLAEVTVTTGTVKTFHAKDNSVYLSFDFYDDYILSLVNKGKTFNVLQLSDNNGNILSELPLKLKAEKIFKDCFDNIHLLSGDSVYQVYYDYQKIILLKSYPISFFRTLLEPCECAYGKSIILKFSQYRGLKNSYILFNEQYPAKGSLIACIADSVAIKGFNMDYNIHYFLNERRKGAAYMTSLSEIKKYLDQYREELILSDRYSNLLRPVESELIRLDSTLILIDYTNKFAQFFSVDLKVIKRVSISGFGSILPKMYYDAEAKNIVFVSINDGLLKLLRYDTGTNSLTHKYTLRHFHHVTKFNVKGNELYFIYTDRNGGISKSKIHKTYINWQQL